MHLCVLQYSHSNNLLWSDWKIASHVSQVHARLFLSLLFHWEFAAELFLLIMEVVLGLPLGLVWERMIWSVFNWPPFYLFSFSSCWSRLFLWEAILLHCYWITLRSTYFTKCSSTKSLSFGETVFTSVFTNFLLSVKNTTGHGLTPEVQCPPGGR